MTVTVAIVPLISMIFGVMYIYNSRDFVELLLSQPIKRSNIFLGQYLGLALSLSFCYFLGVLIPFVGYGIFMNDALSSFVLLLIAGVILTFIFTILSFYISMANENRIKGFGLAILVWLYLGVIYDGLILLGITFFEDYPLEKASIVLTILNPIDITRVMVLLKLEISALMGYTGAVFKEFFGTFKGILVALLSFALWVFIPLFAFLRLIKKKNF